MKNQTTLIEPRYPLLDGLYKRPITPRDVKLLREATGAGLIECKKALEISKGHKDIAIAVIRSSSSVVLRTKNEKPLTGKDYAEEVLQKRKQKN